MPTAQSMTHSVESTNLADLLERILDKGVVVAPPLLPPAKDPARVVSIEPYGGPDRARVVITLTAPTTFEVGQVGAHPLQCKCTRSLDSANGSAIGNMTCTKWMKLR